MEKIISTQMIATQSKILHPQHRTKISSSLAIIHHIAKNRKNIETMGINNLIKISNYHLTINNLDLIVSSDFLDSLLFLRENKIYTRLLLEIQSLIHKHKNKNFLQLL